MTPGYKNGPPRETPKESRWTILALLAVGALVYGWYISLNHASVPSAPTRQEAKN